jgi:putative selenate reductase FAD-binding subunit
MVERFLRPAAPSEAVQLCQELDAAFIAGGTELNCKGAARAPTLVCLDRLGLAFVREEPTALVLGAGLTLQDLADNKELVGAGLGVLGEAARAVGSRSIRCQATLGGNVAANKSCSDLIPTLLVLDASLLMSTKTGEQELALQAYLAAPDRKALIKAIRVPRLGPTARVARQRFSRTVNDLATINVALALRLEGTLIAEPRLALGGVAPHVLRATAAEDVLAQASVSAEGAELAGRLGEALRASLHPVDDIRGSARFKMDLAVELSRRALRSAIGTQGGA